MADMYLSSQMQTEPGGIGPANSMSYSAPNLDKEGTLAFFMCLE